MEDLAFLAYQLDQPSPWQIRFEDRRVRMVLEAFRLLPRLRALLDAGEAETGERRLTFPSFHRLFPSFPILLATRCRGRVAEHCGPAALFRHFERTFLLPSYLEVYCRSQEEARGRPVGMVVPFDGYRGGMVVHDGTYDTRGTKMFHDVAGDRPPHRVTAEPFPVLLEYLARSDWAPDSPPPDVPSRQARRTSSAMPVTPSMARQWGKPPLVVLAWLRKVLLSESAYDRRFVRRLDGGGRCVEATHAQIAAETGLSQQKVKRGLEALRGRGLVLPASPEARSCITVAPAALKGE